ncbi:BON domain-containing protein [Dactylosporangium sp. NBC_01737]|uniref:BON domain-containing protein n=1 Tax=Dactylosporangium sp. NBC_01737 TaxID=2975959 RepID=UPI002E12ED5D|nr:BON domain-containing protein [Dactylosporangium sp. NBC_01737]
MTRTVPVTVAPEMSVLSAARLMDATRLELLPVVTSDGKFVGTLTRHQVRQSWSAPDRAGRDELAGPVLRRVLAHTAPQVRVDVNDGVVTLTGSTDRRSTAEMVSELARAVPGVVGVVDRIAYANDDTHEPPPTRRAPQWDVAGRPASGASRR